MIISGIMMLCYVDYFVNNTITVSCLFIKLKSKYNISSIKGLSLKENGNKVLSL